MNDFMLSKKLAGLYRMDGVTEDEREKLIRWFTLFHSGELNEREVWERIISLLGEGEHLEAFDEFFQFESPL
jgi:hypothetical protein